MTEREPAIATRTVHGGQFLAALLEGADGGADDHVLRVRPAGAVEATRIMQGERHEGSWAGDGRRFVGEGKHRAGQVFRMPEVDREVAPGAGEAGGAHASARSAPRGHCAA